MTTPAFAAAYADFKLVKTRACVQIIFEIPLENSNAVLEVLGGMPTPAAEKWFGIAPLDPKLLKPERGVVADQPGLEQKSGTATHKTAPAASPPTQPRAQPKQSWASMSYAAQAGMLCNELPFYSFIYQNFASGQMRAEADEQETVSESCAHLVRKLCNVNSRADIIAGSTAERYWRRLVSDYRAWQIQPSVVPA